MKNSNVLVLMEWYDHRLREGIGRYAAEKNWYLTVNDGCRLPQGWSGDGIITLLNSRADMIRYIRRQRVPCVDVGAFRMDIPLPRICGDHREIGVVAADHLSERGFHSAAYFATEYQHPHALRGAGFAERFQAKTGNAPRFLIWEHCRSRNADNWQAQYRWLKRELKALPKPLAVFCYCDYDAAKIESACLEAGFAVPDDIAILGVDNDALDRTRHRLEEHVDRVLGQTVYATLMRLRLFEVKRRLALTDQSIKAIAESTGFCHAQHLNNAFRRFERCTPTAFRKRERRQRTAPAEDA